MTTREYIYELRCCQALAGSGKKVQESFDAAIAALERQAKAEHPKRLAPFPWRSSTGVETHIIDADGSGVCIVSDSRSGYRHKEIIAHILAHSQGEPQGNAANPMFEGGI